MSPGCRAAWRRDSGRHAKTWTGRGWKGKEFPGCGAEADVSEGEAPQQRDSDFGGAGWCCAGGNGGG